MIKYKFDILSRIKEMGYTTYDLRKKKILNEAIVQKLRTGDTKISLATLDGICRILNMQPGDLVEYIPDDEIPEEKNYTYYSVMRPVSISTYPKSGMTGFQNYDRKTYVEKIDRDAWGILHYKRPLTEKEKSDYELVDDPENP